MSAWQRYSPSVVLLLAAALFALGANDDGPAAVAAAVLIVALALHAHGQRDRSRGRR